jgi:hypothetical protein
VTVTAGEAQDGWQFDGWYLVEEDVEELVSEDPEYTFVIEGRTVLVAKYSKKDTTEPTPEVTPAPGPTPEVTPAPGPTPEVTSAPEPTPEVTPAPGPTPEVTPEP